MQADVTQLLVAWSAGEQGALERLLPLLYDQLKDLARVRMRGERAGHTLSTTGLVHEAYLRLVDVERVAWQDRAHFFAMASRTMRRVLVDHARARRAQKRGAGGARVELEEEFLLTDDDVEQLIALDDVLQQLEVQHPRPGKAVELRYFGGLTLEETADALGVSPPTVMRDVRFAEAWLARAWSGQRQ